MYVEGKYFLELMAFDRCDLSLLARATLTFHFHDELSVKSSYSIFQVIFARKEAKRKQSEISG
jgi:hypothetical protein